MMAYSQKDVTDGIQKKKKKSLQTDELMDKVDKAFDDPFEKEKKIEKKDEEKTETIDTEIMDKIQDEFEEDYVSFHSDLPTREKNIPYKPKISIPLIILICTTILCAIAFFVATVLDTNSEIYQIISCAVLSLFSVIYLLVCLTSTHKKEFPIYISAILLLVFFLMKMNAPVQVTTVSQNKVQNFSGKTMTDVMKWANQNNIKVTQEYEYSDMVPEFEVISQSVKVGTDARDIDEIVVAVSEGPNPFKEIIVPSMLTWDDERVINFVLNNYLSNVIVEFAESDQVKDTVIEQSKSGNLRRNEELRLVLSFGEEGSDSEVSIIDFTGKSKFEIEFFMKQHKLNYDFVYDFSDTIKKGYGVSQSIAAGEVVPAEEKIQITISKGPKIVIPDLSGKEVDALTEWAIDNHLKLEFVDKYDDSVKKGKVISIDKEKGDVVEQGTLIKVTLSLGSLKMPKFKNIDAFYNWADKYGIKYEIKHEFNDEVAVGEIIEFSYKSGAVIKNDDVITVTVSDGAKAFVPNLIGLTKSDATKKLKHAGLNYNFVYRNNTKKKDTVIGQSITSGSEVSSGTTITVTLSNGKSDNSNNNNSSSNDNSGGGNQSGGNTNPNPSPSPSPVCNSCTVSRLTRIWSEHPDGNYTEIANALIAEIERQCPGIDVQVRPDSTSGEDSGTFISGFSGGDTTSCSTVYIYLAK